MTADIPTPDDPSSPCADLPIRVAIVDDLAEVELATAAELAVYPDRVRVVDLHLSGRDDGPVDVLLLDCAGERGLRTAVIELASTHPGVGRVVVHAPPEAGDEAALAFRHGASGLVRKGLHGEELTRCLVEVHRGRRVCSFPAAPGDDRRLQREVEALTEREVTVLAHLMRGRRTKEIAEAMFLSVNTIKSHTQQLYRKILVNNRSQAILWGLEHGFPTASAPVPGSDSS